MPATYEPIATVSPTSTPFEFTSIPGTYTDLKLVMTVITSTGGQGVNMRINNSALTIYSQTLLLTSGSGATSNGAAGEDYWYLDGVSSRNLTSSTIPIGFTIDFFDYAGTKTKQALIQHFGDKNGTGQVHRQAARFDSSSAITSLKFFVTNVTTGTIATLYGIKAA